MRKLGSLVVLATGLAACGGSTPPTAAGPSASTAPPAPSVVPLPVADAGAADAQAPLASAPSLELKSFALPGATDAVALDYIGYDHGNVWIPFVSGKVGFVDVFDTTKGTFASIGGLKVVERESHGKIRSMGPSSVAFGDGVAYVGNRGTSEICIVDVATQKIGKCVHVATSPDGIAYVASAHELWATTPETQSFTIFDATNKNSLKLKTTIKTDGDPEGYAVDADHNLFFANLEDKSLTLAIDVKTHKVVGSWANGCGTAGPRGIAIDSKRQFAIVACTDHLQIVDAGHGGALLGKLDTGAGVDNIVYASSRIYAGAGKAGRLTIASVDDQGQLAVVASGNTADGARNAVASEKGAAYLVDGKTAHLLVAHIANP